MVSNDLRFARTEGIPVHRLASLSGVSVEAIRIRTNALARWRYIEVRPPDDDDRARPPFRDWIARPLPAGRRARALLAPLTALVEERWRIRFGEAAIDALRKALSTIVRAFASDMPYDVPILGYGFSWDVSSRDEGVAERDDLPALLSQVLNAIAKTFAEASDVSLALAENTLRLVSREDVRIADLPLRAGISKEATAVAIGYLQRAGLVTIEPGPATKRGRLVRATVEGRAAYGRAHARLERIEKDWSRSAARSVAALHGALEALLEARDGDRSLLGLGLEPAPGGWRSRAPYAIGTKAMIADPQSALPRVPLVWHRGGWPDGS